MSFFRRLKTLWLTIRQMRALRREGITDPEELKRRLLERVVEGSGKSVDSDLVEAMLEGDPVPSEARELWEEYDSYDVDTGPITEQQLSLLRRMRFAWNRVEVGAPRLDTEQPYGSPNPLKDMADVFGEAPTEELARRHADMTAVLNRFLEQVALEPGSYEVEGRTIQIGPEHLTLAKALHFSWDTDALKGLAEGPWPGPSADPKRPYGNLTFFEKEMAFHLGWLGGEPRELTEDEIARLGRMHHEMLDVVRVLAAHGAVAINEADP